MAQRFPLPDAVTDGFLRAGPVSPGPGAQGAPRSTVTLPPPIVQIAFSMGRMLVNWAAVPGAVDYVVETADGLQAVWLVQATTCDTSQSLPINNALRLIRVRARK